MPASLLTLRLSLLTAALALLGQTSAIAQSVVEASDGGTEVRQRGRTFDIDGGTRSGDGQNLFHSFEQFGLDAGEIANFLSDPETRNILGRVMGGDASLIDGLLRVSGSDANLFLINPAGVIFGESARLDVGGDFTATTATGIGFGEGWFPAVGEADYSALVGDPTAFDFAVATPGSIVNAGELTVAPGASLTLLGGSVLNTGTLTAPGGTLTIAAVAGDRRVRITQEGMLLGLELETQDSAAENALPFTPLTLPELLTGGGVSSASAVQVSETGEIRLSGSGLTVSGPTVSGPTVSGLTVPSGSGTAIASGTLDASDAGQSTAEINVVGDRVVVADATLDASGADGGTVRVGGDLGGDGPIPNARDTLVTADSAIHADALSSGDGGTVAVWSDETATVNGVLTARGGAIAGDGGFIETSGSTLTLNSTPDASAPNGSGGTWLIDPTDIDIVAGEGAIGSNTVGSDTISAALNTGTSVTITTEIGGDEAGNITQAADAPIAKTEGGDAQLAFEAAGNIALPAEIVSTSGALDVTVAADVDDSGSGAVVVGSGGSGGIVSNGGNITITGSNSDPAANLGSGVRIQGALLSGGGDIEIAGDSTANSGQPFGSGFDRGISIGGEASRIESGGGNITLTGTSIAQDGIVSFNGIESGDGDITVAAATAVPDENPIDLLAPVDVGTGTLTLQADVLPAAFETFQGTGTLQLQPFSPSIAFDPTAIDLTAVPDTFSNLLVGDPNSTAPILISDDLVFSRPLTLQTTGGITFDADGAPIAIDGPSLSAISGDTILINSDLDAIDLALTATNDIVFNSASVAVENLSAIANNDIVIAEGVSLTFGVPDDLSSVPLADDAAIALTANADGVAGGDVTMDSAESITIPGGRDLSVSGENLVLGTLAVGDFLQPFDLGDNITGFIERPAADVTLSAVNDLSVNQLESSANTGGGLTVLASPTQSGGDVSLSSLTGNITVAGSIRVEADPSDAEVDLVGGSVTISAAQGNVTIGDNISTFARDNAPDSDAIDVDLLGGDIDIDAPSGAVTVGGQLATFARNTAPGEMSVGTGGDVSIAAGSIRIDNAADDPIGVFAIEAPSFNEILDAPGVGGAIALTAPGGVQVVGDLVTSNAPITVDGPATLSAAEGGLVSVTNQGTTGAIAFGDALDAPDGLLVISGAGAVTFDGAVGSSAPLDSLSIESSGTARFNSDISAVSLTTDDGGSTDLGLNPTLSLDALSLGDTLLGSGTLTLQTLSPGLAIALGTPPDALPADLVLSDAATGQLSQFSGLAVGRVDRSNDVGVFAPVTVNGPITLTGGDITVDAAAALETLGGDLTLEGDGVDIAGALVSDGGAIAVSGDAGGEEAVDVTLSGAIAAGDGDIALTGNQIDIAPEATVSGSSLLLVQPDAADLDIELGGAAGFLSQSELDALAAGFGEITIGQPDSTGSVTLSSGTSVSSPLTIAGGSVLIGPDQDTTFTITDGDGGSVSGLGSPVQFENFEAIAAGSGDDTFLNGSGFDGGLDGGAGFDTFEAEANGTIELAALDLENIEAILGNNSTLLGTAGGDEFSVVAPDTVEVQSFSISELARVDGGAGGDLFQILTTAAVNDFIRGGPGDDEISYAALTGPLSVDLAALNPEGIETLTGSAGDDTIQLGAAFDGALFSGRLRGGPGDLTLRGGTLDLTGLTLRAAGDLTIASDGMVTVGNVTNPGTDITITGSAVTTGNLNTGAAEEDGGAIALQSDSFIETGNLISSGLSGGDVRVEATTEITTGRIDTSGALDAGGDGGDGGNVLLDPSGDIQVTSINAQGGPAGVGGTVDITTESFFRATGQFVDQTETRASISTAGGAGGGPVTIRHGGAGLIPFSIGAGGDDLLNGTLAAITSGSASLLPVQSIKESVTVGNLQILTEVSDRAEVLRLDPCPPNCGDLEEDRLGQFQASDFGADVSDGIDPPIVETLSTDISEVAAVVSQLEDGFTAEFSEHLQLDRSVRVSLPELRASLQQVQAQAGIAPAILYVTFEDRENDNKGASISLSDRRLELILVTADGMPLHLRVPEVTQRRLQLEAARLRRQVSTPSRVGTTLYEASAQQLYRWLIAPVNDELASQGIDTLGVVTDAGLRSLPFAALHDGTGFLVERYALTLVPSASLTYLEYENLQQTGVLLGGASQFANQSPLPFVPVELNRIQALWGGDRFQGDEFTRKALADQVQQNYSIVHLATHGEFQPGSIENSYIQFSDGRLQVDELKALEWRPDDIRLVTLSACQTALGNREAELGFAGLAVAAGAQSALASLWSVSDAATTGLMIEFYKNLQTISTKAQALRAAQLALIEGMPIDEVVLDEGNSALTASEALPSESQFFRHPFYWSAFTLVGSPW